MNNRDISILIVDDAKFSSAVVSRTLSGAGYGDIRHASSAREALKHMEERPAALVIADWLMPEMDGLDLTRHVRQLDEQLNRYTYIILLTAREGVTALQKAFDEGVDDFVNKSSMNYQLISRVMAAARLAMLYNNVLSQNQSLIEANAQLKKYTTLDSLTGYGNRQYAVKHLDDALRHARQRGGAACLLLLRVEKLDELGAQQGKAATDQLLLAMSRRLRQLVRPMDLLARLSADIFALITYQQEVDNCTPGSFKRLYDGLNLRAYKTAAGFFQARVSISMCAAGEGDEIEGELLITRTQRGLDSSRDNKRIIAQPLSG